MEYDLGYSGAPILPSDLTGKRPRKMRMTGNGMQMAAGTILFFAFAVVCAIYGWSGVLKQAKYRSELRNNYKETVGEIQWLGSVGRSPQNRLRYTFSVNGTTYKGEAAVPNTLLHDLAQSTSLSIRYVPFNPAVNHPAEWEWSASFDPDSLFASILGVIVGMVFYIPLRRERQLIVGGEPTSGVITKCSRFRSNYEVKYEFQAEDRNVTRGRGWSNCAKQTGERVHVLYMPQNPRRNRPYPSPYYRIVG